MRQNDGGLRALIGPVPLSHLPRRVRAHARAGVRLRYLIRRREDGGRTLPGCCGRRVGSERREEREGKEARDEGCGLGARRRDMHEKGRLGAENGEGGREALLCDDGRTMGGQVVVVDGCWAEAQRERHLGT